MSRLFQTKEDKDLIAEVRAMRQRIVDDAERALHDAEARLIQAQVDVEQAQAELVWVRSKYEAKK